MAETFVLSFVDKLILLEEKAGARVHYRVMSPFSAPFQDCLSVQKAARQLADSIGLTQFTFIIAFAKQKKKVGGHIDLGTRGSDVFIEVDPDAMAFPDSIGATLCHEVCHKWLQVMGISSPIEMDNEILTDITALFLGFGKIVLNGCRVSNVRHEPVAGGTRTITETRSSGYLSREQLAFVYRLACAMRNVPVAECMNGLNREAAEAVRACDVAFGHHYSGRFHQPDATAAAAKGFDRESVAQQRQLAELNKHLDYVKKSFCETVEGFLTGTYRTLEKQRQQAETTSQVKDHDPALRFLRSIRNTHELEQMAEEVATLGRKTRELLHPSRAIVRQIWQNSGQFPSPSASMFNIVNCPQDGTKLRLPPDAADLMVVCPTCHCRFAYDTTCISLGERTDDLESRKPVWARRLRKLLRLR